MGHFYNGLIYEPLFVYLPYIDGWAQHFMGNTSSCVLNIGDFIRLIGREIVHRNRTVEILLNRSH